MAFAGSEYHIMVVRRRIILIFRLCRIIRIRLSSHPSEFLQKMSYRKGLIMYRFTIKFSLLLAAILICGVQAMIAEDFRVENQVFVEGKKEPESRSLTLFHGGMVYDIMSEPSEVTVFDKAAARFVLLNLGNQEQTEVSITDVETFAEKLKQLANKQKDPLSKFFADPKMEERFDAASEELTLTSPWVTYRVITKAAKKNADFRSVSRVFRLYSRLNAMLNPVRGRPRLDFQVNDALAGVKFSRGKCF